MTSSRLEDLQKGWCIDIERCSNVNALILGSETSSITSG
jgi:hypothetical protein